MSYNEKVPNPPKAEADSDKIRFRVRLIKPAKAPLVILGKGAAYSQAEGVIRRLIDFAKLLFLPTPMGKGVMPDSYPSNQQGLLH